MSNANETVLTEILNTLWSCGMGSGHDLVTRFERTRMQEEHVDDALNQINALLATQGTIANDAVLGADELISAINAKLRIPAGYVSNEKQDYFNAALSQVVDVINEMKASQPSAQPSDTPVGYTSAANLRAIASCNANAIPMYREKIKDDMVTLYAAPQVEQPSAEAMPVAWIRKTDITEWTDSEPETDGWTPLYATPPTVDPSQDDGAVKNAERYQLLKRGQQWSVINGIGDILRGDALDRAIDAEPAASKSDGAVKP